MDYILNHLILYLAFTILFFVLGKRSLEYNVIKNNVSKNKLIKFLEKLKFPFSLYKKNLEFTSYEDAVRWRTLSTRIFLLIFMLILDCALFLEMLRQFDHYNLFYSITTIIFLIIHIITLITFWRFGNSLKSDLGKV